MINDTNSLIGKTIEIALTIPRNFLVIGDYFVDDIFGSGAVKITPAHDQNNFEAGKRHDLALITVIDQKGKLTLRCQKPYAA